MIYNQGFGGGMKPKIIVTAPTGTVVTATKGTTTITASESGGKYVILADDYGTWTITGTKGSQSVSEDVEVVAVDTYEVTIDFTPKVLNDATWAQIQSVADASTGPNYWSVGDTKQITLNGKVSDGLTLSNYQTWVYIIGFDHNSSVEGTGIAFGGFKTAQTSGIDVALCDSGYNSSKSSGQWFNMNNSYTNRGGWASCRMRSTTLPLVKSALPSDLQAVLKTTSIYSDNTGGGSDTASYVTATQDELYLLAEFEIFGARTYANSAERNHQQQYAYYVAGNSKIKYRHDSTATAVYWWERSVHAMNAGAFCFVDTSGAATGTDASLSNGLAVAFKVGSNPPPQPISVLAVGSSVYCNVNGVKTEFVVVHQGKPSDMYDDSCNGAWLLMKDVYEERQWNSSDSNSYKASTVHSYLNGTFLNLFDSNIKDTIKQVKIPYVNGIGNSAVSSGANGLSAKIFLLSGYEVGWTTSVSSYFPVDGAKLSYFESGDEPPARNRRIAELNGSSAYWWLRSPYTSNTNNVWLVDTGGGNGYSNASNSNVIGDSIGIRPAFILPFDTQVDFQGNIVI